MMPNHTASFKHMQDCFTSTLARCTQHHQPSTDNSEDFQRLCGVLNSGMKIEASQWTIKIFHNFAISIQFYEFNLPCSENCTKASLNLWSQSQEFNLPCLQNCADPSTASVRFTYCGMRLSWSVSFKSHTVSVEYRSLYIYPGFYFVTVYEAVDLTSPLIADHIETFLSVSEPVTSFLSFGNIYSNLEQNRHDYYIKTDVLNRVCLKSVPSNVLLCDGPGPKSQIVQIKNNSTCFSSYYGFVRHVVPSLLGETFANKIKRMRAISENITWFALMMNSSSSQCKKYAAKKFFHMTSTFLKNRSLHCVWKFNVAEDELFAFREIHIKEFNYQGMNFLSIFVSLYI